MRTLYWGIPGHDGRLRKINCFVCQNTTELQNHVRDMLGHIPCDCTELVCLAPQYKGVLLIFIQDGTQLSRLAHEAFHAALMLRPDASDYTLHRPNPKDPDFGFVPNEVAACLCEEIFALLASSQKTPE